MVTAILLLLVIVPLAVLAVRSIVMLARFVVGGRRDAAPKSPKRSSRAASQEYTVTAARAPAPATPAPAAPAPAAPAPAEWVPATVPPGGGRVCSICGQQVLATALLCRHCGAALSS